MRWATASTRGSDAIADCAAAALLLALRAAPLALREVPPPLREAPPALREVPLREEEAPPERADRERELPLLVPLLPLLPLLLLRVVRRLPVERLPVERPPVERRVWPLPDEPPELDPPPEPLLLACGMPSSF
jgi:hypothetical protein